MKKICFTLALVIVFILTGCGGESSNVENSSPEVSFEEKTSHLPEEAITQLNELPDEVKGLLRIPTEFPSEPSLSVMANPPKGDIVMVLTHYFGVDSKWSVMVHTYPNGDGVGEEIENTEKIKLDNGAEIEYHTDEADEGEKVHFIQWREESGVFHLIQLMQNYENPKDEVTKDKFIEIVNSMK